MLCLSGFELYSRWVPLIHHVIPNVHWFGTQVCQVFIQTKIISNFIVLNLTADWKTALAQVILMVSK